MREDAQGGNNVADVSPCTFPSNVSAGPRMIHGSPHQNL